MSNLETGPKKTRHSSGSEWKDGSVPGPGLASRCSCSSGHSLEPEGNVDPDPASKASLGGEERGAPVGAALEGSRRTGRSSKRELPQGPFSRSGACTPAPAGYKCCFRGPGLVAESNRLGVWPGSKLLRRLRHSWPQETGGVGSPCHLRPCPPSPKASIFALSCEPSASLLSLAHSGSFWRFVGVGRE